MALVYVGLGSNLGDRTGNLLKAAELLERDKDITILKRSSMEETVPHDYLDQPDFMNQVVLIETAYGPRELLRALKKIEYAMGRREGIPKGPRIIDLDILLYESVVMDTENLIIPHPGIKKRDFVRKHLIELDPDISDPATGERLDAIL